MRKILALNTLLAAMLIGCGSNPDAAPASDTGPTAPTDAVSAPTEADTSTSATTGGSTGPELTAELLCARLTSDEVSTALEGEWKSQVGPAGECLLVHESRPPIRFVRGLDTADEYREFTMNGCTVVEAPDFGGVVGSQCGSDQGTDVITEVWFSLDGQGVQLNSGRSLTMERYLRLVAAAQN